MPDEAGGLPAVAERDSPPSPRGGAPEPGRLPSEGGPARAPGWREVLVVAGIVLAAVFAVEILSVAVAPLGDLFRSFPTTIVVLVAGTVGLLALLAVRRPRA